MADPAVQKEPVAPPAPETPAKEPAFAEVMYNDSITLFPSQRLAQYDKGSVKAYAAKGRNKAPVNIFAMVCEDHITPRTSKAGNYVSILNPSLLRLVASGVADWPPAGKEKYVFIYENILGQPLMKDDIRGGMGMKHDIVLSAVIKPIINVLADMRDKDIIHGCIRPSNIFDGGAKNFERAILGECLSVPPSYHMPVLYETIDRALATPSARGTGTQADDLYSLGVTIAVLLRNNDPLAGLDDDAIIEHKMEEGSYAALTGKDRFTGAILELLRGLLHDDVAQRWTLDDVMVWLDGRRLSPKQATKRPKASRPITFNLHKYMRPEMLAKDLNKNPNEAKNLIESGDIEQWIIRALDDKVVEERYEAAIKQAEEGGKTAGYNERLITRVCMALNPEGPIRFKTINVIPDGIGPALTEAFIMKRDLQVYHDFFMNYFITQWIDFQTSPVSDVSAIVGKFDSARAHLRQKGMGGGMERCIYALNPEVHCLSEKLIRYHVRSPEDLMHALEKMASNPNKPAFLFDRHIIAFLSVKDRKNIDPYIPDMNAPEPYKRVLGEMKTLATIQKRSNMEKFPGIATWLVENLDPVYERFHDRELRKEMKKRAERAKESGDLIKIISLFDNQKTYQDDFLNFRKVIRQYYDLDVEYQTITKDLQNESTFGQEAGYNIGALVSALISAIIIFAVIMMAFSGGGTSLFE